MGVAPRDFWAMGLKEWAAAAEGFAEFNGGRAPPGVGRAEFEALKRRFPDRPPRTHTKICD